MKRSVKERHNPKSAAILHFRVGLQQLTLREEIQQFGVLTLCFDTTTSFKMSAPAPRSPEDLLKWSIAASNAGGSADGGPSLQEIAKDVAEGRRPDLADPKLFDALMGKSEAQMMREELAVGMDTSREEQDRVQALDNFEMVR
jgi:hypothetical protein